MTANGVEAQVVLALYNWASSSTVTRTLTLIAAQWLVFFVPLSLLAAWWWPAFGSPARRRVLLACGVSAVLNGILLLALTALVNCSRPFEVLHLTPLFPHALDSSFPSDHTMLGMALAAPLLWQRSRLGPPLGLISLLVGFARVVAAVHWPTDILGSVLLALAVGLLGIWLTRVTVARIPRELLMYVGLEVGSPSSSAQTNHG